MPLQVVSASGIVFANKAVMTTFGFKFIYALTLIHTLCTLIGMQIFCCAVSSISAGERGGLKVILRSLDPIPLQRYRMLSHIKSVKGRKSKPWQYPIIGADTTDGGGDLYDLNFVTVPAHC
jgi:hypothetical protein